MQDDAGRLGPHLSQHGRKIWCLQIVLKKEHMVQSGYIVIFIFLYCSRSEMNTKEWFLIR